MRPTKYKTRCSSLSFLIGLPYFRLIYSKFPMNYSQRTLKLTRLHDREKVNRASPSLFSAPLLFSHVRFFPIWVTIIQTLIAWLPALRHHQAMKYNLLSRVQFRPVHLSEKVAFHKYF